MPRFYIPPESWRPEQLTLDGAEAHHCSGVMRMKAGDQAAVFNGKGSAAEIEIVSTRRDCVECRLLRLIETPLPGCRITLAQAIPKGKNMEFVIEKATELGAAAIVPLLTERTIVRLDSDESERKREKWQRIALEAAKQCGQNWIPNIELPQTLEKLFGSAPQYDLLLIGSLEADARLLKKVLKEREKRGGNKIASALILIGPEGDFTPSEMAHARAHGCQPITFGPIILRTETAAIYCLSVLSHELFSS